MSAQPVLSVTDASKIFSSGDSQVIALDHVSLEVARGEVLSIVGPSGSGKTTLLMIAGLIEAPTSGRIQFQNNVMVGPATDLNSLTDIRRRHIGFVFQRANLIPFLTALENVQIALQLDGAAAGDARGRAMSLLDEMDISHRYANMPNQLSGGEQQRVAIARALANKPDIIFADEPTAALDSARGRRVMEIFGHLARREGVAVVVVTHDQRAADLANRVIEMADGRITRQYTNKRT